MDEALLREILEELRHIRKLLTPADDKNVVAKQVKFDNKWEQVYKLPPNVITWSLFNASTETIEVAYTQYPDENAIKQLAPRQEMARDTNPEFIFVKRQQGNTGTPYPIVVLEYWMHKEEK